MVPEEVSIIWDIASILGGVGSLITVVVMSIRTLFEVKTMRGEAQESAKQLVRNGGSEGILVPKGSLADQITRIEAGQGDLKADVNGLRSELRELHRVDRVDREAAKLAHVQIHERIDQIAQEILKR